MGGRSATSKRPSAARFTAVSVRRVECLDDDDLGVEAVEAPPHLGHAEAPDGEPDERVVS
jgi:hypothetical protein